ncbi:MAG: hypothetical protein HKO76_08960 [Acidimicrobiia bacterium]|nr:hypothetical protein [Acidimicrobiia bacterium]
MAQKVWNVSDDPGTPVAARTIMVLGKAVPPGRYIWVDEDRLKRAAKVKKAAEDGLLFIGEKLPKAYLDSKMVKVHLKMPTGHARAHGPDKKVVQKPKAPPPKAEKKAKEKAKDKAEDKPSWSKG